MSATKLLKRFDLYCYSGFFVSVVGLFWGALFLFEKDKFSGPIIGALYLTNANAFYSYLLVLGLHLLLSLWYILFFLKIERLSIIGMHAIFDPVLLTLAYIITPPVNVLLFYSLELSLLSCLFFWLDDKGALFLQSRKV